MSKFYEGLGKALGGAIAVSTSLFFIRLLSLAFLWFSGWVLEIICGGYVAHGMNLLFNTTRFSAGQLPMISVVLGFIGGFFIRTHEREKK